ncbi:O-antigen ligase family protein [Polynucleobacter sp. JS-Polo-80-F4]|uniref:O-antigen ligase family protein n=1 Tax=Polynucleobacter sp. JS-Polo-80-F4 TaxID=2576918 RepID=UPI001C0C7555|nr:O-antigen ligase family protein [Polynucleobacter sp. JS-Polo-80-F4]MBU3616728.1 O-antigen ligase family protein [Polynucleobacter sp. JS-Polo-80-F4]
MFKNPRLALINCLGLSIAILCAVLLAIWAMQHTIALRNILLSLGCLLSIAYIYLTHRIAPLSIEWRNITPLFFIGCLFIWVLIHYFLFSQDEQLQLKELKSIWFRGLEASLLGWACGLVIAQKPSRINLLGYGLIGGFVILYFQYLPRVWASHQLFHPDYLNYVFYGKINGVLIGTLLIAGAGGRLIDLLSSGSGSQRGGAINVALTIFAIALPLYAYVYIFDAKNGIGLAIILAIAWGLWGVKRFLGSKSHEETWKSKLILIAAILLLLVLIAGFGRLQLKQNPSWQYLMEDVRESVQIDKYPQWKSPSTLGYPTLPSGRVITPNVFERVSWATAGLILIPSNPWGNGILQYPLERTLTKAYPNLPPNSLPRSTHSGWIDIALSFGFPALICIWGALASILYGSIRCLTSTRGVLISLVMAIICLYTFGELSNHHAVEILLFTMALLAALNLRPKPYIRGN